MNNQWTGMLPLVIFIAAVWLLVRYFRGKQMQKLPVGDYKMYCTTCGISSVPERPKKGHWLIELVLYFFYIVPGIVYSVWRRSGLKNRCPNCGAETMIPLTSPKARKGE